MISVGNILMCEDVRPELNNKLSLVGLYQKDIYFESSAQWVEKHVVALKQLTFYYELKQVPESVNGRWRLVDPEGNDTVQPREISIQGAPEGITVVVVSITPCLFEKEGDHVMVLELGDQTFERPFGVHVVEELPKQGSSHSL